MKKLFEGFRKFVKEGQYYTIDPDNPPSIEEIIHMWSEEGKKAYDPQGDDYHQAFYSPKELIPYREYDWSSVKKRLSDELWLELKDSLSKGFDLKSPIWIQIGANGIAKIAEGNHRLALAIELGIESIPVSFTFAREVWFMPQSFRYVPPVDKALDDMLSDMERKEQSKMIEDLLGSGEEKKLTPEEQKELDDFVDLVMDLI